MNSDPHDSAAWRLFGMLDSDETAGFDDAMRHDLELENAYREMDRLTATMAAVATIPVAPREGQLERLHLRLGLVAPRRKNWLGISGWAAAAALGMILIFDSATDHRPITAGQKTSSGGSQLPSATHDERSTLIESDTQPAPPHNGSKNERSLAVTTSDHDGKAASKVETKRLIQEIEVLREKLANFQARDRQRFEATPGMAWPVVMRMGPPEPPADVLSEPPPEESGIAAMLGDALTAANLRSEPADAALSVTRPLPVPVLSPEPAAVPIYDAARDTGTLVVSNLPATSPNEAYHLWVTTGRENHPVYVGRLPESTTGTADSIDFSLGSTAITPSGFVLTKDAQDKPLAPSTNNTVLLGPR
jgi:hypothetical protein